MKRHLALKGLALSALAAMLLASGGIGQSSNSVVFAQTQAATMAGTTAMSSTMAATMAGTPAPYDGGTAVNAPDMKGKKITLIDVPKLVGIGYFAATTKGEQEAATELGNVSIKTDGPTTADIDKQIQTIDTYVTQGVDGVLFSANDPVAIAPELKKALAQGIHVIGYDANANPDAREWFVNQASADGIAKAMVDSMVAEVGEKADVAIVTSSLTAPNQNEWIADMKTYIAASHPGINIVDIKPSEEDQQLGFKATQDLLKTYPNVKGIFGLSSVAFPAAADAVTQAKECGKVAVVGLSTPNQMRPFVTAGCVKSVILWNPIDLGYAAVYAMRATIDGTLKPGDTQFKAGRLGTLSVSGSTILLGPAFVFTKDNIANFDF